MSASLNSGNTSERFSTEENGKIIICPIKSEPNPGGLGYEYFKAMKKNQSKIAQYIVDTEEEETYGLLLDRCIQVAIKLKNEGITKNDILCLCTNNHKQSIIPFISGIFLNVKVCSLDPSLSQEDITYLIDQVKPTIFFICLKSENLINRALHDLKLNAKIVIFNHSSFDEYLDIHVDITEFEPIFVSNLMETAVIFFSSGTTGFPKGICINHYALLGQAAVMINSGNGLSISLSYSTPYWISSVLLLTSAILSGSARVICSSYNSETFWSLLDKYKVTLTFLAPIQAIDILKDGRPDELDTSHLHMLLTGGGSLTETYIYQLRELLPGTFICQGYGQTEVGGVLTCFQSNDIADTLGLYYKPESCGRPIPGITYKVVNPENELLCEAFERGELRIKSKYIMNGYYRKNSSDTFDSAGWLKTGDIVYFDNDYFFFVVDRIKEMLKYRSWHVAPAVLEKIIATHPAVEKAVVIGIPHHEDGDHPLAVVVLRKNYENVEPEEIQNYVDAQVDDRQKLRGGVKIVNYIPLTPSGKVKRTFIRSLILNDRL